MGIFGNYGGGGGSYGMTLPTAYRPPILGMGGPPARTAGATGTSGGTPESLYGTATQQGAEDYSSIMQGYKDLIAKNNQPNSEYSSAVTNLGDLAKTGGYSEGDKSDIRARGISPIRSVYSSAMQNVDRQRSLSGGYSPNYGAVQAKMARDLSSTISDKNTDINATIAQNVAGNRTANATGYANAAKTQSEIPMQALQGMTSLYGTTPANAALFGNNALQRSTLQANVNNQGQQGNMALIGQLMAGLR